MTWTIEATKTEEDATRDLLDDLLRKPHYPLPSHNSKVGVTSVKWWEPNPGDVIIMAEGGSVDDRTLAEQVVKAGLEANGYQRISFAVDDESIRKTAGWPDIMGKAKRLIQSGNVTVLRNGYNVVMGHVIGDHGEYTTEIGRDDPSSRAITTWKCECPWDQYAWQRTRQWKKYEGRPCAHVMALYWKSLATPLDDYDPEQHGDLGTGQKTGPPPPSAPPSGAPGPSVIPNAVPETPVPMPSVPGGGGDESAFGQQAPGPAQAPMAPPADSGVLPPSPMEQLQMMQPPMPGATPGGMPAPPGSVSVPGAKLPSPFNPIQYPGGTYSADYEAPQIIRLKNEVYGIAEGKSDAHGNGQYQPVPAGSTGEVLGQDETTGWIEAIFPLDESGPLEPYHVRCFLEPSDVEGTRLRPPGPFIKRRY